MIDNHLTPPPENPYQTAPSSFDISIFWRVKWIRTTIIFAALTLLIATIIRLITPTSIIAPTTITLTTNLNGTSSSFNNIVYSGEIPNFPNQLPIGVVGAGQVVATNTFITNLITTFNLTEIDNTNGIWSGRDYTLMLDKMDERYSLLRNSIDLTNAAEGINTTTNSVEAALIATYFNEDEVLANGNEIISSVFPNLSLQMISDDISYFYSNNSEPTPTNIENANQAALAFSYTINDIPVYFGNKFELPFSITIDTQYKLKKASFYPFFINFTLTENQQLLLPNEAVANINEKNLAAIISAYQDGPERVNWNQIESGQLNSVRLEYRYDKESGYILPFYRFTGILTTSNQRELTAEIITPAVQVQSSQ